jgi:TonB-dependent starch-binding outer membrane protein SusC
MKKLFCLLTMMTILLFAGSLIAQEVVISGTVVDAQTREPLAFANVSVQGERAGAATQRDGRFTFRYTLDKEINLVASYMGYASQQMTLNPGARTTDLLFEMTQDIFSGETVVVTGVASERARSRSEVSVARVDAAGLTELQSYTDISSMLTGKVPGVVVKKTSGNVGGAIRFDMRANPGLGGAGQPLVIVDGVQMSTDAIEGWGTGGQYRTLLADLNPDEIASIDVLKGPAATASYGTDGSNGVVVITTKRGQGRGTGVGSFSPFRVNYKTVYGLNTQSYKYKEGDFESWEDANSIFRDGAVQQHALDVSGGSPTMRYFVGIDRREEEGLMQTDLFDRTSLRANIDVFPSENLSLQFSANYIQSNDRSPENDNNITGYYGNTMLRPVSWTWHSREAIDNLEQIQKRNRFMGGVIMNYSPIKNLRISGQVGIDEVDLREDKNYPFGHFYSFSGIAYGGMRMVWNRNSRRMSGNLSVSYAYSPLKGLDIISSVGNTFVEELVTGITIQKKGFETGLVKNIGAASDFEGGNDTHFHVRRASLLTTHQFSFKEQYFATVTLRNEYSSQIGMDASEIFYPNATFAVRMDQYNFFPKFFQMFKVRAGYGESGELPGRIDGMRSLYAAARSGFGTGAILAWTGNTEIEPERIKEFEIGFDAEFFGSYAVEFTYIMQSAEQAIIGRALAPSTGINVNAVPYNVGEAKGWGWEAMLRGRPVNTRNFVFDFSLTHSFMDNEVLDIGDAQPIWGTWNINVIKPGLPKYTIWVHKVHGARFNEDGTYAGVDADAGALNRTVAGYSVPKHNGAIDFNFRLFRALNLRLLADWAIGQSTINLTEQFQALFGNHSRRNELRNQLFGDNAFTPGTPEYIEAAHAYAKTDGGYDYNVIYESDVFKLREISLSYDLSSILRRFAGESISSLVLGVSGTNLWMTTKYPFGDPDVSVYGATGNTRAMDFLTLQHPRTYEAWLRIGL